MYYTTKQTYRFAFSLWLGVMSLPIESVPLVVDSCFINSDLELWANKILLGTSLFFT